MQPMGYDLKSSLLVQLRLASQSFEAAFARAMTEATSRQIIALEAIERREGAAQIDLVHDTGIDRSTMAEVVRRLHKNGLITRRRKRSDARTYTIHLTQRGRDLVALGRAATETAEQELFDRLSPEEQSQLRTLLYRLTRDQPDHRSEQ